MNLKNLLSKARLRTVGRRIKDYFDLTGYLIPQAEAEAAIREGVSFRGINILILIFAIFIASLGLNTNSTAVIIGAMLISPLMGPIIGLGLAVGIHDFELMKRSFRNLMMATAFSVATSCVYFLLSPVNEAHSELLARTSPTIYDVFIGFFGGAAGILAIGSKIKGNVIPGVAIATALMPPLCTVGYGLATLQPQYFIGALYLFFINGVFIACATTIGVKFMKYAPKAFANPERARKVRRIVLTIALLTMVPAAYLTYSMYVQNNFRQNCENFVHAEFDFPDPQVLSEKSTYSKDERTLTVALMGRIIPQDSLLIALEGKLAKYNLQGTHLRVIQGDAPVGVSATDMAQAASSMLRDMYTVTQGTITRQQQEIDSLRSVCATVMASDTAAVTLAPELKVLFPRISAFSVATTMVCDPESGRRDTLDLALIRTSAPMAAAERKKFLEYLKARLGLGRQPKLVELPK